MPSGPPELHAYWSNVNTDGTADNNAIRYLEGEGYKLTRGWEWILPSPTHTPTPIESMALSYLVWEWDFGGLAKTQDYGGREAFS